MVLLDKINKGDASEREDLVNATTQQFKQVFGNEYTEQFINAMKADVGVEKNDSAIKGVRDRLTGRGGSN